MMEKRVAFYTLGCKLNQYDTESLAELFRQRGYSVVDFADRAHVYVINTCTVTASGERKSRQAVHRAVRRNPQACIVVAGCYAQTAPVEAAALPGVDLIIGNQARSNIVDLVEQVAAPGQPRVVVENIARATIFEELPIVEFTGRTRATMKIQDGCNQFCTYCKIPFARGPSRSRAPEAVIAEAKRLVAGGFREIVLTGIHLGAYGRDLDPTTNLAAIVDRLGAITGLLRLRLGSVDAPEIDDELLEALQNSPIACRHLHIPLQGGDDDLLRAMGRPYTLAEFAAVVEQTRLRLPGVAITTDIIVGFPGESAAQFANALRYVEKLAFTRLHVFRYSPRRGTVAAADPRQIAGTIKRRRSQDMIALGRRLSLDFHRAQVGQTLDVLWEEAKGPPAKDGSRLWEGHTDTYIMAEARRSSDAPADVGKVAVHSASPAGIRGTAVED